MLKRSRQATVSQAPVTDTGASQVGVARSAAYPGYTERVNPAAAGGVATVGLLTILVGAWAGIIPYVGPVFGYNATGTGSFVWNQAHALLWLVPGAAAVLLGFMLLTSAPLVRAGVSRIGPMWIGLFIALCGAWLVIGPFAWPVLEATTAIRFATPLHELTYLIGYSLGPGVVLALFGGSVMGMSTAARSAAAVVAPPVPESSPAARMTA